MIEKKSSPMTREQMIDLGVRTILGLTFAFSAGVCFKNAMAGFQTIDFDHLDTRMLSHALSMLAISLYALMVGCLYALRLRVKSRASGAWPCAAAILGSFLMSGLLVFNPRDDLPLTIQILACLLVLIGNGFTVYVLTHLGRSFSILPESRKVVTSGPYRVVRHPLYLAEAVTTLGVLISFLSPWALLLVAAQLTLQVIRIHYEERTLSESFPEYKDYAKRTWRLIPGIY
jgi:protein-S-isoprenylcysteine O-methyltransferase Ste14